MSKAKYDRLAVDVKFEASGTNTISGTTTVSGTVTDTATRTIGTGGVLSFSGTGYESTLGSRRNRVEFFDDFNGVLTEAQLNAKGYTTQKDTSNTILCVAGNGGVLQLLTDATDDDTVYISGGLNWKAL